MPEALGLIFTNLVNVSTRRDLLPEDIADELKRLQDQVPPFPGELAAARVENELEMTLAEAFAAFDACHWHRHQLPKSTPLHFTAAKTWWSRSSAPALTASCVKTWA